MRHLNAATPGQGRRRLKNLFRPRILPRCRWLRWLTRGGALLALLAVAFYPWVVDSTARAILAAQGLKVSHSKVGYDGIEWAGLGLETDGVAVLLERLRIGSVARLIGASSAASGNLIEAEGLQVALTAKTDSGHAASSLATPEEAFTMLEKTFGVVEKWIPTTKLIHVEVQSKGGVITIDEGTLRAGRVFISDIKVDPTLELDWDLDTFLEITSVSLERLGPGHFLARMDYPAGKNVDLLLKKEGSSLQFVSNANWKGGDLHVEAEVAPDQWTVRRAQLQGEGSSIPVATEPTLEVLAPVFNLDGHYDGATGRYAFLLDATGKLPSGEADSEVWWVSKLRASGDAQTLTVETFHFDLPWLQANLSGTTTLDLVTWLPENPVELQWAFDWGTSPLAPFASGSGSGLVELRPSADRRSAWFRLKARGEAWTLFRDGKAVFSLEAPEIAADGVIDERVMSVETIALSAPSMGRIEGGFQWDRNESRLKDLLVEGTLGPAFLLAFVEETVLVIGENGAAFSLQADGALSALNHSGRVTFDEGMMGQSWPFGISAEWRGRGVELDAWSIQLERSLVKLTAEGSLRAAEDGLILTVGQLNEEKNEGFPWALSNPVTIKWIRENSSSRLNFETTPIELSREHGGRMFLEGRMVEINSTQLHAELSQISEEDLKPWWIDGGLPKLKVREADVDIASVLGGDGRFTWAGSGGLDAVWTSPRGREWEALGSWVLSADQLAFDDFYLRTSGVDWVFLSGTLPFALVGDAENPLRPQFRREGPLALEVELNPIDRLPFPLEERLPFDVSRLTARLSATGTLSEPTAVFEADAAAFNWLRNDGTSPIALSDVKMRVKIQGEVIELTELRLTLPGEAKPQKVVGRIGDIDWASWMEDWRLDRWVELSAELFTEQWPVSSIGLLLPEALEPVGRLSLDLTKKAGEWPKGTLSVAGLMSRPFADGLVLRGINGSALVSGRRLEDIALSGSIGGQPWNLVGWLDGREEGNWLYQFSFSAQRIDLTRRADLMLRAKADLELIRDDTSEPPLLRGDVELLRSLWLRNLRDFTRRGAVSVARRPPYFSVDSPGLRDWRLDLRLSGSDFLQVRATVLTAEASADFDLRGTLGDPLLVGDATIEDGTLIFPFGRLAASDLRAWISDEAPHTVQLSGDAEGVAYGYTVRVQIGGTADVPTLLFSSTPALPQQDILLMLATGAVPSAATGASLSERAGRLALYLGQDIFSEVIGADGASRIELRYGDGFSPFRKDSRVIEYRLNDDWSVLGEYDDFGGYNVDLRWRVFGR